MSSIDVGISHDNNLMITSLFNIKFITNTSTKRCNDRTYLGIAKDAIQPCFFNIQDFTTEWQNRLKMTITALLRRSTGRVTFDDIQFTDRRILGRTVRKLTWKSTHLKCALTTCQFTRLTSCLTSTRSLKRFFQNLSGYGRILLHKFLQLLSK
ncbi:hypothetical protein D3C73_1272550 [compost metagenome]